MRTHGLIHLTSALLVAATLEPPAPAQVLTRASGPGPRPGIRVVNTNIPGSFAATDGKLIAFHTDEALAGQDLDGDTFITPGMYVIQVYVIASGTLVNTMQQGLYPSVSKQRIAFERWEQNGGINKDWNADGDFQDHLIAYYDLNTGATVDTLIDGNFPDADGDHIVFYTYESSVGPLPGTILNNDGDTQDPVIRYYTISTATLTNTGAAGTDPSVSGDTIVFATRESYCWNGVLVEPGLPLPPDLNGDGDLTDTVLRYHSIASGVTTFTGLDAQTPTIDGVRVAYGYDEAETAPDPPFDADGDVDTIDRVLTLFRTSTGLSTGTMLPITSIPTVRGHFVAFDLEEIFLGYSLAPAHGTELNANAFPGDHIVCFYDIATGAFTSTAVTGFCDSGDSLGGDVIAFSGQYNNKIGYVRIP